jgi:FRG domain
MSETQTLSEAFAELEQSHGSAPAIEARVKDITSGEDGGELLLPAHVFRGEADASWDATHSSMERLRSHSGLSSMDKASLEELTQTIDERLRDWFGLSHGQSAGLLQHYCLPTELIDVSPELEVAAFFAAYQNVSGTGSITIFNTKELIGHAVVMDLTSLEFAHRPISQHGYGVFHRKFTNLHEAGAFPKSSISRRTFRVTSADLSRFLGDATPLLKIYEDDTDPMRAVICNMIDSYTKNVKKLSPKAAEWLARRIPPTPLILTDSETQNGEVGLSFGRPSRRVEYCPRVEWSLSVHRWAAF